MTGVTFNVDEAEYRLFKELVGKGGIAQTLRNYVKSYAKAEDLNEIVLRKRFEIVSVDKAKLDAEYFGLKAKIDALEATRKAEELRKLEVERAQQEQMSQIKHDLMKSQLARKVMGK